MRCSCDATIPEGARYCPRCGRDTERLWLEQWFAANGLPAKPTIHDVIDTMIRQGWSVELYATPRPQAKQEHRRFRCTVYADKSVVDRAVDEIGMEGFDDDLRGAELATACDDTAWGALAGALLYAAINTGIGDLDVDPETGAS